MNRSDALCLTALVRVKLKFKELKQGSEQPFRLTTDNFF
jgi:hypothetical protein